MGGDSKQTKEHLIELVQFYPVLYDPSREDYKNRVLKENAWKEVAERLLQKSCNEGGNSLFSSAYRLD